MPTIHPTAVVDPLAQLGEDVQIGPYAVIEGKVTIGPRTVVRAHTVLGGPTIIGADCRIGPAAHVGLEPQHLGVDPTTYPDLWLIVGDKAIIREGASIHRASKTGRDNATRIGDRFFLMGGAHVAHDSRIGDDVVMAHGTMIGGHVQVGSRAFIGGGAAIHQFCRVGRLAIVAGNEAIMKDIPPFAAARYGGLKGYNAIGCRRGGLNRDAIFAVRRAFHLIHTHRAMKVALSLARQQLGDIPEIRELIDFVEQSRRGVMGSLRFNRVAAKDDSDSATD